MQKNMEHLVKELILEPSKNEIYAVITADIVASRKIPNNEFAQLITSLTNYLTTLCKQHQGLFKLYRGDSFQMVFKPKTSLFYIALLLRLFFIKCNQDVRLSMATGNVLITQDLATATGDALVRAGEGIDTMKNDRLIFCDKSSACFALNIKLIDKLLSKLSAKQAQALFIHITEKDLEHAQIAEILGTSRANITKLLNLANYSLINEFLTVSKEQLND